MSSKAIFLNDTSGTSNPGCQGTVSCLLDLLASNHLSVISRLPVGYGYREFSHCNVAPPVPSLTERLRNRIARTIPGLKHWSGGTATETFKRSLCPDRWTAAIDGFTRRVEPVWVEADHLIVNGEGTIHHDSIGARNLIGLCVAGKRLGMHVSILNCSIYELSETLLAALRQSVDQIVVREPISFRYLADQNISATLAADCLFRASSRLEESPDVLPGFVSDFLRHHGNVAVYTPGVLSGSGQVAKSAVTADIRSLVADGYKVFYYVVEAEDEHLAAAASNAGAKILPLGSLNWTEVFTLLRSVSLVVSGRYHINIFAAISGVPFIPMETNTAKMDGLLELLGCVDRPVRDFNDQMGTLNLEHAIAAPADVIQRIAARFQATPIQHEISA